MYFLVHTGARISEARGFSRKNWDEKKELVYIRQRADEQGKIGHTKSAEGVRDILFVDDLVEPMNAAFAMHDRDLLWSTRSGTPMNTANLYKRCWNKLLDACEEEGEPVPRHGFHAMRHTYASRLIAAGANLKTLQRMMGHHSASFPLDVYGHLLRDDDHDSALRRALVLA